MMVKILLQVFEHNELIESRGIVYILNMLNWQFIIA